VTPLQKVAMGLVIVFLHAPIGGYDALPDPLGWALVIAGVWPLRARIPSGDTATTLAVLAGLISLPLVVPSLDERLTPSGQWGVSVPQTVFCLVLAISLSTLAERDSEPEAKRFALLRTAYIAALIGPVLVYGGGVTALAVPVAVLAVLANVALVYLTFKVSKRSYGRTVATP
jgi:hypothetical protein